MPRQAGLGRIHVAAGILRDAGGRVLLTRRPAGKHLEGLWEFPGGKLEPGEAPFDGLARELAEELGIRVRDTRPLISLPHDYPEKRVRLDVFEVLRFEGEPRALEGQAMRWVGPDEMPVARMPAADRPVVTALRVPDVYAISPDPWGQSGDASVSASALVNDSQADDGADGVERAAGFPGAGAVDAAGANEPGGVPHELEADGDRHGHVADDPRLVAVPRDGLDELIVRQRASKTPEAAVAQTLPGDGLRAPPPARGREDLASDGGHDPRFDTWLEELDATLAAGVRLVQLRVKSLPEPALRRLAAEAAVRCRRVGARLLLNGPVRLVRELDLDGVHLDSRTLMSLAERPLSRRRWVAASCHDETELRQAEAIGVDFACLSPVKATASHPGAEPMGFERFGDLVREVAMPVYALGGCETGDLGAVRRVGGQGIAGISGLWAQRGR